MKPSVKRLLVAVVGALFLATVLTATGGYYVALRVVRAVRSVVVHKEPSQKDFALWYHWIFQSDVPAGMKIENGELVTTVVPPLDTIHLAGIWPGGTFPPWRGNWTRNGKAYESEQGIYHCTVTFDATTGRFQLIAAESWN